MLVVKYQRRIERLIGRMVRDVDLVQDIAQETFIGPTARCAVPWATAPSTPGCTALPSYGEQALGWPQADLLVSESALYSGEDGEETSRA